MTIESLLKNWTSRGKTVARKGVALRCVSPAHMPERAPDDGRVYLPSGHVSEENGGRRCSKRLLPLHIKIPGDAMEYVRG